MDVLLVMIAKDCIACHRYIADGTLLSYEELNNKGIAKPIIISIPTKDPRYYPISLPIALGLDGRYPNFKYMTYQTFLEVLHSGDNWKEISKDIIHYYAEVTDSGVVYESIPQTETFDVESMKRFCMTSRAKLYTKTEDLSNWNNIGSVDRSHRNQRLR
jgi:hypothetical protein